MNSVAETMVRVRYLETRLQGLCDSGELAADLHFSTGQEAVSAGMIAALRPTDYVVTHHRTIAHAVAKGVPLLPLVAELMGKAGGLSGGLGGEMHLSDMEHRFAFCWQLVGTCVPVAAGLAWAVKNYRKSDDIVVCFFGDAATSNGQWHEGVNLAAVHGLPLLLVCENNHLAGNVTPDKYLPQWVRVTDRAKAYGIVTASIDGNNSNAVLSFAPQAAKYVRAKSQPFLLDCDTTRLGKHKQGQGDLRTKAQIAELAKRDPLLSIALSDARRREIEAEVDAVIAEAQAMRDAHLPATV